MPRRRKTELQRLRDLSYVVPRTGRIASRAHDIMFRAAAGQMRKGHQRRALATRRLAIKTTTKRY